MQTFTGAAQTWLVVNIPATVARTSETISARSRFLPFCEPLPVPSRLMSQKTPEARKPLGATMEPGTFLSFAFMRLVLSANDANGREGRLELTGAPLHAEQAPVAGKQKKKAS